MKSELKSHKTIFLNWCLLSKFKYVFRIKGSDANRYACIYY